MFVYVGVCLYSRLIYEYANSYYIYFPMLLIYKDKHVYVHQ